MAFDDEGFAKLMEKLEVPRVSGSPYSLASGGESHAYLDWKTPLQDIGTAFTVARHVLSYAAEVNLQADQYVPVPNGTTMLANVCNILGGKQRFCLPTKGGDYVIPPQGRVILLEDTITTGGSIERALEEVPEWGAEPIAIIGLTNRMAKRTDGRTVRRYFDEDYGVPTFWLSEAPALIPEAYKRALPELGRDGERIKKSLEQEFHIRL